LAEWQEVSAEPDLGNVRPTEIKSPSRFLTFSPDWTLVSVGADKRSAWSTSRLEFWKHPEMMAQFPSLTHHHDLPAG